MQEIELKDLVPNPFNSRIEYNTKAMANLADSLRQHGLLVPIKVRRKESKYEIVFGHRRIEAAKMLGWNKISAEVEYVTDEEMLQFSLVENLKREDLSDYEKALTFYRFNKEFGKSIEETARLFGYSKSHIYNFINMLNLFDKADLNANPSLHEHLLKITEHHARLLARIEDTKTRINTLNIVTLQNLSVRDLQRMIDRLRSWYDTLPTKYDDTRKRSEITTGNARETNDIQQIKTALINLFKLPHKGNFDSFVNLLDCEGGFSMYDDFPPFRKLCNREALEHEREWFYVVGPNLSIEIQDLSIEFFENVALATLYVDYNGTFEGSSFEGNSRGSVLFVRKANGWKIVHLHWSKLEESIEKVKSDSDRRVRSDMLAIGYHQRSKNATDSE